MRHVPLQYALTEYRDNRAKLLELLACLNRAAEKSKLIGDLMESGELFHPLRLTSDEAYEFLQSVPAFEQSGISCRIPNWWKKRYSTVALSVKMGEEKPSLLRLDTLLRMTPSLTIGGVPLTEAEIQNLLRQTEGLSFIKGKWIEVNHERLKVLLKQMKQYGGDFTLLDALRSDIVTSTKDEEEATIITNGKWLRGFLNSLRNPKKLKKISVSKSFNGELRPYQEVGYLWLMQMNQLGFGACLADDMGLGKTVQILAFLEALRFQNPKEKVLLIVPASLLGNWQKEAVRFTPELTVEILHGAHAKTLTERFKKSNAFLTITTYRMAMSIEALAEPLWDCIILDEAQAIKNPSAKQTRQIKRLNSRMRVAMTGTPIENDLSNLWSLFDFLNKGLLGSFEEFKCFCRGLEQNPEGYAKLKSMIAPFLLRRVKTDKKIISDLPDKLEIRISPLSEQRIEQITKKCSARVKTLEKLVSGDFPKELKDVFFDEGGLFPEPREISFSCSCPDWAIMCKHIAATLYGVGARLDEEPLLFFSLRGIDTNRFVDVAISNRVEAMLANVNQPSKRIIQDAQIADLFGVL